MLKLMTKIEQKIPEGWSVKKLENCFSFSAGGDVDKDCFSFTQDEAHPYPIYANALTNQGLYGYSSKYKIAVECITITGRGDIGKVFYRKGYFTPIVRLITAIPKQGIDAKFMSFSCSRICFYNETTGVPQLTVPQVQKYKLMLPPLLEQEKIAGILSCWDDGIEKLSALIEKKKIQKKALMQQLLTGKHRLKGFSSPWHEVKLGNIGTTYTGLSGKDKESFGYGKPYIPYLNIYQNFVIDTNQFELVAIKDGENQNTVKYGDIFFTTSSETPDEVGISSVLLEEPKEETYLNSFCFGFRLHDFSILLPFYAAYLCRSEQIRKTMYMLAQGATRFNLSKTEFLKSYIYIPSDLAEQKAIAEILSKADEEIELLNKKLEAFKQEKKALMQQLLTGKIRVKVN